jgi:hypothetical protein
MNKEQQELLDEVYQSYLKNWKPQPIIENELHWMEQELVNERPLWKDMFIHCIKTDEEFSEKWGLKIEERELSWEERRDLLTPEQYDGTALNKYGHKDCGFGYISPFTDKVIHYWMNLHNIPTKQITLTYNNKTIESYE